ncbi:hypothetical protein AAMO2058_001686700 [Amorphochlora amoebiformis]
MGFPNDLVLEKGTLHEEFICGICLSLVEYPTYTSCSHVFCKFCITEWFQQKQNCPKCKTALTSSDDIQPLRKAAPLAWRVLSRVHMRCPLHEQDCKWEGDYSEMARHLTNSKTHTVDDTKKGSKAQKAMARASAEAFKEQGNQQMRARAYKRAIVLYSKALSLAPEMFTVYANRSAAYLQLEQYEESISDARTSLKLNPNYTKGHQRLAKALCELGDFQTAANHLKRHVEKLPALADDHQKALQLAQGMMDGRKAMEEKRYEDARSIFLGLRSLTKSVIPFLAALRSEIAMGKPDNANSQSLRILRQRKQCLEAYVVRAWAMYLSKDLDQALMHCREALRLDPDNSEARTLYKHIKIVAGYYQTARKAYATRDFEIAVENFGKAIQSAEVPAKSPFWASLHSQRAQCHRRLRRWNQCLQVRCLTLSLSLSLSSLCRWNQCLQV